MYWKASKLTPIVLPDMQLNATKIAKLRMTTKAAKMGLLRQHSVIVTKSCTFLGGELYKKVGLFGKHERISRVGIFLGS